MVINHHHMFQLYYIIRLVFITYSPKKKKKKIEKHDLRETTPPTPLPPHWINLGQTHVNRLSRDGASQNTV